MERKMKRQLLRLHEFPPHRSYNDIRKNLRIVPDVITVEEEQAFLEILQPKFRRRRYEGDHWDSVIVAYKETQLPSLRENPEGYSPLLKSALQRIETFLQKTTQEESMEILPYHVVDLSNDGHISPHVDSVKFSGGMVSGLSLLSTRILQLIPCLPHDTVANDQEQMNLALPYLELLDTESHDSSVDLIRTLPPLPHWPSAEHGTNRIEIKLPPRSLYIMTGSFRYHYMHAIIGEKNKDYDRLFTSLPDFERRISIVFRDKL